MIGIYCIENTVDQKKYIGQSINIEKRWREHKNALHGNYHFNPRLQCAWNKYGEESFCFNVVCECRKKELDAKESYYIEKYQALERQGGYNLITGGQYGKLEQSTKKKMSNGQKGKPKTEEHKQKLREANLGKTWSFTTRLKMEAIIRNRHLATMLGKRHSEETKAKMSETRKGRKHTEESKIKMSLAQKGRPGPSEEMRLALSARNKKRIGEESFHHVITEKQAHEIIELLLSGCTVAEICSRLSVTYNIVYKIKSKQTWKHLTQNVVFDFPFRKAVGT